MFTGRDALFSIEQAISRVRADEGRLDAALRSAMDEAARLRREEADGFRVLARIRLDALMREKVIGALEADERQALAMIENHVRSSRSSHAGAPSAGRARQGGGREARPRSGPCRRAGGARRAAAADRGTHKSDAAGARLSRPSRRPKRSPRTPTRRPRWPKPTSPRRASPTKTTRCSCICGARSTGRPRIAAAPSCASSIARSPAS